jgi:hypothetical protein
VHDPLRDALPVKVGQLLNKVVVLQQDGATHTDCMCGVKQCKQGRGVRMGEEAVPCPCSWRSGRQAAADLPRKVWVFVVVVAAADVVHANISTSPVRLLLLFHTGAPLLVVQWVLLCAELGRYCAGQEGSGTCDRGEDGKLRDV